MKEVGAKGRHQNNTGAGMTLAAWLDRFAVVILAALILVVLPILLDTFRLGLAAKYLCFAFPAVGIVLVWGYGGILSLGQGAFSVWVVT